MEKRLVFAVLLRILWLISAAPFALGQGQDAGQLAPPPGVVIRIDAMPKIGMVGDLIRIDLDIMMPAGYTVEVPKLQAQVGDFAIIDFIPGPVLSETVAPQKPAPSGVPQHHRARILAAVYKTGRFVFPPILMKLKTAEGKEVDISSPPVNIEIKSILNDNDPALKDLKKQAEMPEPRHWILWAILALAAFILGAIVWHCRQRRRRQPVSLSPAQAKDLLDLAEADLRDLLARGFPDNGMVKQFYVLLSDIIKRILELSHRIHAAEQTTSEIMDSLRGRPDLGSDAMEITESFLLRCDVVKFAKYVPSKTEHEAAARDALEILALARKAVVSRQSTSHVAGRTPQAANEKAT